ncbi:TRIC cation channel family protein [Blastopirellula sp. JC732]|uniref:TRIC cation channel family protein n=1 Tax=Blastopirellula sediminis TaxID=2894196 RepID=A0A9X1MJQ9_9BACT|nr:TRIC cation channel family protein [Blastopirellula sediminis]MCC9608020.1 TRIC cation channel family protein [Blastopirellula sediminis]MCC9627187.1 TRIC cation channel family protein [Blastopirellula sediminis]
MTTPDASLSASILAIMYFGDIVFSISGALTAARYRMDVFGFLLIGTTTGIGGGTLRDLLLGRTVWWTQDPTELLLCVAAALLTFFFLPSDIARRRGLIWADALGLAAFCVVGCSIALEFGSPPIIAVFMGLVTATGGGVIRDVLANTQPMITSGQPYAAAALLGSLSYAVLRYLAIPEIAAEVIAFAAAFGLRGSALLFDIRMGPPGEFLRIGKPGGDPAEEDSSSG